MSFPRLPSPPALGPVGGGIVIVVLLILLIFAGALGVFGLVNGWNSTVANPFNLTTVAHDGTTPVSFAKVIGSLGVVFLVWFGLIRRR